MPDSFFPLDVNFFDHPKVIGRSDTAVRLYLAASAYANRQMTDGYIPRQMPGRLVDGDPYEVLVPELVDAVLWHEASESCPRGHVATCPEFPGLPGWRIHDFLEHNRSKEKRLEAQKAERDRKAAWRERKRKDANDAPRDTPVPRDAGVPRDTTRDSRIPRDAGVTLLETETETTTFPSPSPDVVGLLTGVGDMPAVDNPVDNKRREGKGRPPRTPRHPSDEFVIQRARQIRAESGPDAAQAYLKTVAANYGQMERADQLRRLDELIAQGAAAEDGGS